MRIRRGRGRGQNRGRGRRGEVHRQIPDEIRATLVDHVVNHGLTMAEAGRRVQPNVGRTTVNSIIQFLQTMLRSLQHAAWFAAHGRMVVEDLSPYSPFLNPIEEFFSAWRWKVYDRRPHAQMALLAAMDAACDDITVESCRGWIRHSRRYFPRCLAKEDICCDVDENMWPDRQEHVDVQE